MLFVPRLTIPEAGNPFYNNQSVGGLSTCIKGSPTYVGCNVLANCVGYAAGRFNEIACQGKTPTFKYFQYAPNAENFFATAQNYGLKTGSEPKLGAIIVWQKGATLNANDGAGHVAVVEQINTDGSIVTSESGYGCSNPFWTQKRVKGAGNWGAGNDYKFLGFIYQPEEQSGGGDGSMINRKGFDGIDVSHYQGKIDWDKVKKSGKVKFALLKLGFGRLESQVDETFDYNYAECKRVGIPVGVYWYSYALNAKDAALEAKACLAVLKKKKLQLEFPVFYDVEDPDQFKLDKNIFSDVCYTFLDTVEKAGWWVGIYNNYSGLMYKINDTIKRRFSVWLADYDYAKYPYTGSFDIWQPKTRNDIPGINCDVDYDIAYKDFEPLIKAKGLNGWGNDPSDDTGDDDKPVEPDTGKAEKLDVIVDINGTKYSGTLSIIK